MSKNLNESNFKESISSGISLIDFHTSWCNPCKTLGPIIDEISFENPEINVAKVDADQNMDLCKEFNVRNIPTILLFKNGEVVERTTGLKSKKDILEMIERHS